MPDIYLWSVPSDTDPDDIRLRDPTTAAGGGSVETIPVTKADTVFAGRTVSVVDLEIAGKADIGLFGKTVLDVELERVDKANAAFAGRSVVTSDNEPVARATVAFAGQNVVPTDGVGSDTVIVNAAAITITGQVVTVVDPLSIPAITGWAGQHKRRRRKTLEEILAEPIAEIEAELRAERRLQRKRRLQQEQEDDEAAVLLLLAA